VMLGCMALRWRGSPALAYAALAFVGLRLAITTWGWQEDSRAFEQHLAALDQVPAGARILVLVPYSEEARPQQRDFSHLAGYAVVRRDAFVNSNFSVPGLHMLGVKKGGAFRADPSQHLHVSGSEANALRGALRSVPAGEFDFVWILGKSGPVRGSGGLEIVYQDGPTALLRVGKAAP
jgi:hypothetical protein